MDPTNSSHVLTIGIITYKRPIELDRLLRSLLEHQQPFHEILVVDNDPAGSARAVASAAGSVRYVHEPRRGKSYARNRLLDACTTRYLASIDDDEIPEAGWSGYLFETITTVGAAMAAGPVLTTFESPPEDWVKRAGIFDRPRHAHLESLPSIRGGNVIFDVHAVRASGARYDARFNRGGQDIQFSLALRLAGNEIVWDDRAIVVEHVGSERISRSWVRERWRVAFKNHWRARMVTGESPVGPVALRLPYKLGRALMSAARLDLVGAQRELQQGVGVAQAVARRPLDAGRQDRTVRFAANWLPQYRVAFHAGLRESLASRDITYELSVSQPEARFQGRQDQSDLEWAGRRNRRFLRLGGAEVILDPIVSRLSADVLVLELQAKILTAPLQLLAARLGLGPQVVFFGHGSVDRTPSSAAARWYKRHLASAARGWLVYTDRGARDLVAYGADEDTIAVIRNTTDVGELADSHERRDALAASADERLGLSSGPLLLHIGGLESSKRLDLVCEVYDRALRAQPDLQIVIAGAGPEAKSCEAWASDRPGAHCLPPQFGEDKSALFHRADLLLHPGKIGLIVIDSFAVGVPIVGARGQMQAPEFDYLGDDSAFLAAHPDAADLTDLVLKACGDRSLRREKSDAARRSYADYPMSEMVRRAADGLEGMLDW
ncbi:MAG: glycosyltransferase [Acidimicrobiales bacterium]